jgi:hypothetical protein
MLARHKHACPHGTAICNGGKGAVISNTSTLGFDTGVMDIGQDNKYDNLVLAASIDEYTSTPAKTIDFISIVTQYQDKKWQSFTEQERIENVAKRAVIEKEITDAKENPTEILPLLHKLYLLGGMSKYK